MDRAPKYACFAGDQFGEPGGTLPSRIPSRTPPREVALDLCYAPVSCNVTIRLLETLTAENISAICFAKS